MSDEERLTAMQELIKITYENMGYAILDINPFAPGMFKLELIDGNGPKEALVTVLLQMVPANAPIA